MNEKIAIIGENEVQRSLMKKLKAVGVSAERFDSFRAFAENEDRCGFEKIILPFPSNENNCITEGCEKDIFMKNQKVIGGLFDEKTRSFAESTAGKLSDYFENEAYVLKNAVITSQGAVRLLLEQSDTLLSGKKVLVTGFGRIGRSLGLMLKGLGLKVFIAARRDESLAMASAYGFDVIKLSQLKGALFYFDFIFNTVPERIFSEKDVSHIRGETLYFELASSPYGAEKSDFSEQKKKFIDGKALPGRFYPEAVAENIADFIFTKGDD